MSLFIASDVGGTQLRAALFSQDSLEPIQIVRAPTQDPDSTSAAPPLDRLRDLIASIYPQNKPVTAISVAAPGPINPEKGLVLEAPNIPGWINVPLRQALEDVFHVPVMIGNDANLAALGEWRYGNGRGHHHLIYLTISTGIGGGIIVNDQLLLGVNGLAGEVGHVTVMQDGPLCGCGQRGHLEALASGPSIAQWVQDEISQGAHTSLPVTAQVTAKLVAEAAQKGDPLCVAALARAGYFIGQALADYLHIFNPSAIVIGGGVSQAGPLLFEPMQQSLEEHVLAPGYLEDLVIVPAALGDEVGLYGALALALTGFSPRAKARG